MKIRNIITQILFALVVGMAFATVTGIHPAWSIGAIVGIQQVARFIPMPAGLSFFDFSSLTWNDSLENMGGFTSVAYFAALQDILTFPGLSESPSSDAEFVRLGGNFTMKPDKYFIEIYVTPETASLAANNQGEIDGQSFRMEGEYFYPGNKTDCRAFARKINNTRGVLIFVDPDGDRTVIGTDKFPCYFKPSLNYGKAAADRKGLTVAFFQNHFAPGLEYNGSIPLSGSTIPAIS
jgi:hypothetical protein